MSRTAFVCLVSHLAPIDPDSDLVAAHRARLAELAAQGVVLASGPRTGAAGAVTVLFAEDEADARRLLGDDPMARAGLVSYHLLGFIATTGS